MQKWWQKEVVYQIYPRSFYDANQDGIGDLLGIIEKLDYLKELGITMIWICPIYQSPMDDNGYDISDYYQIHPDYGTMEDMECLLQKAKEKGIKIMMDLVINHTSDEHAWFQDVLNKENSPYRDYYIIKEGKDGTPPTNWRSVFGGSVWEKLPGSENQFYFHAFSKKQPCLNWENPKLREELYTMVNWWLDKGIAGFRVDAINFIKKNQAYPNGEVDGADGLCNCFQFCRNQEGIDVFLQELKAKTFAIHDCVTVAEAYDVPYDSLKPYIDEEQGCFSLMFDFNYSNFDIGDHEEWFIHKDWSVKQYKEMMYLSQKEINALGYSAPFLENHDQPRIVNKLIKDAKDRTYYSKTMLAGMYFFLRGVPFIYQGQEIGMDNAIRSSLEEFDDCNSRSQYQRAIEEGFTKEEALGFLNERSRDHSRTPMQWNDQEYAGFSTHAPWLKVNEHYHEINVEDQLHKEQSVLSFYKKMIKLRQSEAYRTIFIEGSFLPIEEAAENVIAYQRAYQGRKAYVICNFQNQGQRMACVGGKVILNNYEEVRKEHQTLYLKPYQCIVFAEEEA